MTIHTALLPRCKQWIMNCQQNDLASIDLKRVSGKLRLSEEHVEAKQFMNPKEKGTAMLRKSLRHDEVPTLFNVAKSIQSCTVKWKLLKAPENPRPMKTQHSPTKRMQ